MEVFLVLPCSRSISLRRLSPLRVDFLQRKAAVMIGWADRKRNDDDDDEEEQETRGRRQGRSRAGFFFALSPSSSTSAASTFPFPFSPSHIFSPATHRLASKPPRKARRHEEGRGRRHGNQRAEARAGARRVESAGESKEKRDGGRKRASFVVCLVQPSARALRVASAQSRSPPSQLRGILSIVRREVK